MAAADSEHTEMDVMCRKYTTKLAESGLNPFTDFISLERMLSDDFHKLCSSSEEISRRFRTSEAMLLFTKALCVAHHKELKSVSEYTTNIHIALQMNFIEMKINLKLYQKCILKR